MIDQKSRDESLVLDSFKGNRTSKVPVWFMRQAGRYLPEYQEIRRKHSMWDAMRTPELASEITLQPIRRFGFDAAIIFADILSPLAGMGFDIDFPDHGGPQVKSLVAKSLPPGAKILNPEEGADFTLRAINQVVEKLPSSTPLIGFCGAPFTLSCYLTENRPPPTAVNTKKLAYTEPKLWNDLQSLLTESMAKYLVAQVHAGAKALQVFDTHAGALSPRFFIEKVRPSLEKLFTEVRKHVDVPLVYFATGTRGLYPVLKDLPFDVLGVDWRSSLTDVRQEEPKRCLQGNIDPAILFTNEKVIRTQVEEMLESAKELGPWVANLGHGILPETPLLHVELVVKTIHEFRR